MTSSPSELADALLTLVPEDGTAKGNRALLEAMNQAGYSLSQDDYNTLRNDLLRQGKLAKGGGPGGSVRLTTDEDRDRHARVKLTDPELKRLWALSAGICNHPECNQRLLVDPTQFDEAFVLGEQAHIAPHSNEGPRRMSEIPFGDRDNYDNIILLCPNCHSLVDGQPEKFTEDILHQWKDFHEKWVRDTLSQAIPRLQFEELKEVAERLAADEPVDSSPMIDVDVAAKMQKNELTAATRLYLNQAVAGATEAQRFINFNEPSNPNFGRRLRASFLSHYNQGVARGQEGDELFWRMYHFASGPDRHDPKAMAPGVAILGYLFTTCEVFDAP